MASKIFKARDGIRNDVRGERFALSDLLSGVNVDLDKTGAVSRRLGSSVLSAGATTSLWSDGGYAFYVRGGTLHQLHADLSASAVTTGVGSRVAYGQMGRTTYWTDGKRSGAVVDGSNRSWGITPPAASFSLASASGDLPAGAYGVTLVYLRDGMESGAPRGQFITLAANSALSIDGLPVSADSGVTQKALYITRPDGGVFYRAAVLPNAATSAVIRALWPDVLALRTQFKSAPPPGQLLGFYNGRAYVGRGSALFYSDPYEYELFDLRSNFLPFSSDVKIFAPVEGGVFVATDTETVFLAGDDPSQFNSTSVAPYGGVLGTLVYPQNHLLLKDGVPNEAALWHSPRGVCLGLSGGEFKNLTGERYTADVARRGSSLFKLRNGNPQYLTTLFN